MEISKLCLPDRLFLKPLYRLHSDSNDSSPNLTQAEPSTPHSLSIDTETSGIQPRYQFVEQVYIDAGETTSIDLYRDTVTSTQVVVKKVSKSRFYTSCLKDSAYRELDLHKRLQHTNIVQLFDTAETKDYLLLLLEHVPKHNYFTKKLEEQNVPFSTKRTGGVQKLRSFCFDILSALQYLHYHGIMHMDLKPSNLLLQTNVNNEVEYPIVKICDFGLARKVGRDGGVVLPWKCGSDRYRAPEVRDGAWVCPKVDLWSFGIFLHLLSVGFRPQDIGWRPGEAVPFPTRHWRKFENTGLQDLLSRCLERDPAIRISAEEALAHPFLNSSAN